MTSMKLTAEEAYLWECACTWRNPSPPANPEALDWLQIVKVAQANRMATLLDRVLRQTGTLAQLPPQASQILEDGRHHLAEKAATFTGVLRQYARRAAQQELETMPMKGLWVSCNVYGDATIRPGHDMDILIRRERIDECIAVLERLGFGRYWEPQLPDDFYRRHHLHLELSPPDCQTWVEIHWAYDHPRTKLTIDYEAVMDRTTPGELLGAAVRDPSLPDLLLYLAIHLVKHCIYLPATVARPDLQRIIVADGRLMYFLDIAEVVNVYGDQIDWDLAVHLAQEFGAVDILGAVLRVCHTYLQTPVPPEVLAALPVQPPGPLTSRVMNAVADHTVAQYLGQKTNPLWRFLVAENYAYVFRPIRLLDLVAFAFPGRGYLQRRYGKSGLGTAVGHLQRTTATYARLAIDTLYYTWQRNRHAVPTFVTLPPEKAAAGTARWQVASHD